MRTYCLRISFPALAFLAALFIFYSCKDELSPSPTNAYDNATFWTNKTNATIALTGIYRGNITTVQSNDILVVFRFSLYGFGNR
jgi:hypothetical protein